MRAFGLLLSNGFQGTTLTSEHNFCCSKTSQEGRGGSQKDNKETSCRCDRPCNKLFILIFEPLFGGKGNHLDKNRIFIDKRPIRAWIPGGDEENRSTLSTWRLGAPA